MITAEVVLDSVSPAGHRLTTFRVRCPRFIWDEVLTHRAFSRNASSFRAVPVAKMIAEARDPDRRATPEAWGLDRPGMTSDPVMDGVVEALARAWWNDAAESAARFAEVANAFGLHKQFINRALMPFVHVTAVITATEYANFFGLRLDADADPTMRALAGAMWTAYGASAPTPLTSGQWHLPFFDADDFLTLAVALGAVDAETGRELEPLRYDAAGLSRLQERAVAVTDAVRDDAIKVSVARCARTSYLSHFPGNRRSTLEEDLALYDRLVGAQPLHASPAEHQATPDTLLNRVNGAELWSNAAWHGNLRGWIQYRKTLPGEGSAPLPEGYA